MTDDHSKTRLSLANSSCYSDIAKPPADSIQYKSSELGK